MDIILTRCSINAYRAPPLPVYGLHFQVYETALGLVRQPGVIEGFECTDCWERKRHLADARAEIVDLKSEVMCLKHQICNLKDLLDGTKGSIEGALLKAEAKSLALECSLVKERGNAEKLTRSLESYREMESAACTRIENLTQELKRMDTKLHEAVTSKVHTDSTIQGLKVLLNSKDQTCRDTQLACDQAHDMIQELKAQLEERTETLQSVNEEKSAKELHLVDLNRQIEQSIEEKNHTDTQYAVLSKKHNQLAKQHATLKNKMQQNEVTMASLEEDNHQLHHELAKKTEDLRKATSRVIQLTEELRAQDHTDDNDDEDDDADEKTSFRQPQPHHLANSFFKRPATPKQQPRRLIYQSVRVA